MSHGTLRSRDTPIIRWDIVDLRHQMITYFLLWPFWCAGSNCTLREVIEDTDIAAGHANCMRIPLHLAQILSKMPQLTRRFGSHKFY
jgi:hypothetical protein